MLDPKKTWLIQFAENEQRVGLTDRERARACEELQRLHPDWTRKEIAKALNKRPSWISRYTCLGRCIPAVRDAFEAGALNISQVYAISRAASREQHEFLAAALNGESKEGLERRLKRARRPVRDGEKTSRIRLSLASGVTVTIAGSGLSVDGAIDAIAECRKELLKGREQGLDGATIARVVEQRAKANG
jgi:ParB-like chromosome segregation protein Spo0J